MKILHIATDFPFQKIYSDLISNLDARGLEQNVFVPVRRASEIGMNSQPDLQHVSYYYENILRPWMKILYGKKIDHSLERLKIRNAHQGVDLIHAHTLFSAGGVAYRLNQETGTPYVVNVRNVDLNYYWRLLPHLRSFAKNIISHASQVLFLNPSFQKKLLNELLSEELASQLEGRYLVLPNALNSFWTDNSVSVHKSLRREDSVRILYVGEYSKNKNIQRLIEAVSILRRQGQEIQLRLVGQYGNNLSNVLKLVQKHSDFVESFPRVNEKDRLLEHYQWADIFAMVSIHESLGMVYLEALSQGLPIVYTQDQGVDGFFESKPVGCPAKPTQVDTIVNSILRVIKDYETFSRNALVEHKMFSAEALNLKLLSVYKSNVVKTKALSSL